jgi:GMP synthase (glutamine-hydrolysing)
MGCLWIVKLGSTFPELAARQGDFEDWVKNRLGSDELDVRTCTPGNLPHGLTERDGVVLTGSHSMVTDREPWSQATGGWLRQAVEAGVWTLGICYGHQLLADVFGGKVGPNPNGREFGTMRLKLSPTCRNDALFSSFETPPMVQTCHAQAVLEPPADAVVLATTPRDPFHALRLGERAWGVQFHPEFDERALAFYVEVFRERLIEEGQDVEGVLAALTPTPQSERLLRRFAQLVACA